MNVKLETTITPDDCENEKLINPFVHHLELPTTYEKIKIGLLTVIVLPIRVAIILAIVVSAWLLACIGLWGLTEEDLREKPLEGWRSVIRRITARIIKYMFVFGGFHVKIIGKQLKRREAPILALAPHSSFVDSIAMVYMGGPSIVAKGGTASIPFFGKLINYTQPVYVWRDDPESRQSTIKEIISRATSKLNWPQILIFPEGTCTNRSCLITFKPGAFYPGVPIQPVCIRYPNKIDTVTWTWEGPSALKLLWLTLIQPSSYCEIEFLPVYVPNEEEKRDPKLYARNVRNVMAKALGLPVVDYTYDDCKLMAKAKALNLPNASYLFEIQNLRCKLGMKDTAIEENLIGSNMMCKDCSRITYAEFVSLLQLPPNESSTHLLFRLCDKTHTGVIDFREYLLGVLALSNCQNILDALKLAFKIYDRSGCGKLNCIDFSTILVQLLNVHEEHALEIFSQITEEKREHVTLDDFLAYAGRKPEFSYLVNIKEDKSTSTRYEICPNNLSKKVD